MDTKTFLSQQPTNQVYLHNNSSASSEVIHYSSGSEPTIDYLLSPFLDPRSPSDDGFSPSPDSWSAFPSPSYHTAGDDFFVHCPTDSGLEHLYIQDSPKFGDIIHPSHSLPSSPTPMIVVEYDESGLSDPTTSEIESLNFFEQLWLDEPGPVINHDLLPIPEPHHQNVESRHRRRWSEGALPHERPCLHDSQSSYPGSQVASSSSMGFFTIDDDLRSHSPTSYQFQISSHIERDITYPHERPHVRIPQSPYMGSAAIPPSSIGHSAGIDSDLLIPNSIHPNSNAAQDSPPQYPDESSPLSNMPASPRRLVVTSRATRAASNARTRNPHRYPCPFCHERFTTTGGRRNHIYSHEGIKPFKCPRLGCNKAFVTKWDCTRHQKVHRDK